MSIEPHLRISHVSGHCTVMGVFLLATLLSMFGSGKPQLLVPCTCGGFVYAGGQFHAVLYTPGFCAGFNVSM